MLPAHMHSAVFGYFEKGVPPGGFLRAVLENKLMEAFFRADSTNQYYMQQWAEFLYMYAPGRPNGGWGSEKAVNDWLEAAAQKRQEVTS